jgi:hypothetical protein
VGRNSCRSTLGKIRGLSDEEYCGTMDLITESKNYEKISHCHSQSPQSLQLDSRVAKSAIALDMIADELGGRKKDTIGNIELDKNLCIQFERSSRTKRRLVTNQRTRTRNVEERTTWLSREDHSFLSIGTKSNLRKNLSSKPPKSMSASLCLTMKDRIRWYL